MLKRARVDVRRRSRRPRRARRASGAEAIRLGDSGVRHPGAWWPRLLELAAMPQARGRRASPTQRKVRRPVTRDRAGLDIDLDDRRVVGDQLAVARRPVVERRADREHRRRTLASSAAASGRGEAAGDPERVGEAGEQPVGRGRGGQQRADDAARPLELGARVGQHGAAPGDDHRPPRGSAAGRPGRRSPAAVGRGRRERGQCAWRAASDRAAGSAWMSIGSISTTGRRSMTAQS